MEGNRKETCDTSSAKFQAETGAVDFVCEGETEVFAKIRTLVSMLPSNNENDAFVEDVDDDMESEEYVDDREDNEEAEPEPEEDEDDDEWDI